MFEKWLQENDLRNYDLSRDILPKAKDREFWKEYNDPDLIARGEKYIGYDWPVIRATSFMAFNKHGDRQSMEKLHFARRKALTALAIGEVLEYKGRFIPDLADGIFAICEETYWGLSAHLWRGKANLPDSDLQFIDLFAAETAEHLASVYYILGDELYEFCPEIMDRIRSELEKRIFVPYLKRVDLHWMGYGKAVNNWNPWIISNLLWVFLLADGDEFRKINGITKMFKEIQRYYVTGMAEDGGCDEGPVYWTRAGARLFDFLYQLKLSTKGQIDLFDDPKIRGTGEYIFKVYISGRSFLCFADAVPELTDHAPLIYRFGKEIGQEYLCQCGLMLLGAGCDGKEESAYYNIREHLFGLITKKEMESRIGDYILPSINVLPRLEVGLIRKGDWVLGAKGGHNGEGHNHNDVGNFEVYWKGSPVLIDSGAEEYSKKTFSNQRYSIWTMQSDYHNLPVINGQPQQPGGCYKANSFKCGENEDGRGEIFMELQKAYPPQADISRFDRHIKIDEQGVVLEDSFGFKGETGRVTEHFITSLSPQLHGNNLILGGKFQMSIPGDIQNVTFEKIDISHSGKMMNSWHTDALYRIKAELSLSEKKCLPEEALLKCTIKIIKI